MLIFVLSSAFLLSKKPKDVASSLSKEFQSMIVFNTLNAIEIDQNGLNYLINAKSFTKKDKLLEANGVVAYKMTNGVVEEAHAKKMILVDDVATFSHEVVYKNDKSFELKGDEIRYDINQKKVSSDKPFVLNAKDSVTSGESFVYDMNEKKIEAQTIKSKINLKK